MLLCFWAGFVPHVCFVAGLTQFARRWFLVVGYGLCCVQQGDVGYRRQVWETPDGDSVAIDFLDADTTSGGPEGQDVLVVMTHGLESRSCAPLCVRMARSFTRRGFNVAVLNFRSCANDNDVPQTPGGYHLGFTSDLDFVTKRLHEQHPTKRIYLSGFSLGGNVILKLLGELGDQAQNSNGIHGAAVTCVPFRPEFCEPMLGSGFNRVVYSGNFLKSLKPKAVAQVEVLGIDAFPPRFDLERVLATTTIGEFDDEFIAPIYGFKDKLDYYLTQGSFSGGFLQRIRVPALAMNAINDPFIDPASLPQKEDLQGAPLRLVYHEHGGNCLCL